MYAKDGAEACLFLSSNSGNISVFELHVYMCIHTHILGFQRNRIKHFYALLPGHSWEDTEKIYFCSTVVRDSL